MKILVSIDDTDNIESRGTGELASILASIIQDNAWGTTMPVTRHQLFVHADIPYTSHNSSMCFRADIAPQHYSAFIQTAQNFLQTESAPGSDPGLCVVKIDELQQKEELISFGFRAKEIVLNKEEAYRIAANLKIHLSEHGGSGLGIIGALAGAGLRLSGNDGRFRGKLKIYSPNGRVSVAEIKKRSYVTVVKTLDGDVLDDNEQIVLGETLKAVLLDEEATFLVCPTGKSGENEKWRTCSKNQLRIF